MLTFCTIPRAFQGHTGIIQRNAIRSWARIQPPADILLFGGEEGSAAIAEEVGARVLDIRRNEFGTPLLDDLFAKSRELATTPLICYINSDIILLDDFVPAIRQVSDRLKRFLMIGRRWNVDITSPIDFSGGWQARLQAFAREHGELFALHGIDYFVFRREMNFEFPPFAVGRPYWDNWFLYRARYMGLSVVDATADVLAIHQNHDYRHVAQRKGPVDAGPEGPEGDRNLQLAGGVDYVFTLDDATHTLESLKVRRILTRRSLELMRIRLPVVYPSLRPVVLVARSILKVWRRIFPSGSRNTNDS